MKRIISVYYDGSGYTFSWIKSLFWAKEEFARWGYEVRFESIRDFLPKGDRIARLKKESHKKHDIVFLAYHHRTSSFCNINRNVRENILSKFKENSKLVCWLDTADSSGTAMFELMPFIDMYFKKQWLKDKTLYYRPIWGGRTYAEYYHHKYNLSSEGIEKREFATLRPEDLKKCRVSWNVGLGDINANTEHHLEKYLKYKMMRPFEFSLPSQERKYDTHFRGSAYSSAVGYQRYLAKQKLLALGNMILPEDWESKVTKEVYKAELMNSKTLISPYGWGEICTRDFEAFAYGALLLKPNMGHIDTFPNWYKDYTTYIPLDWDYEDLEEIITKCKNNSFDWVQIAMNAQMEFKKYRTTSYGKMKLAEHIIAELEK